MKKGKKVLLVLLGVVLLLLFGGKLALNSMVAQVKAIPVSTPDLLALTNGSYTGEYTILPVSAEVEVTIQNHRIMAVTILRHDNGLGGAAERLADEIVFQQSLELDSVSGATVSSKCILKAAEAALIGGSMP